MLLYEIANTASWEGPKSSLPWSLPLYKPILWLGALVLRYFNKPGWRSWREGGERHRTRSVSFAGNEGLLCFCAQIPMASPHDTHSVCRHVHKKRCVCSSLTESWPEGFFVSCTWDGLEQADFAHFANVVCSPFLMIWIFPPLKKVPWAESNLCVKHPFTAIIVAREGKTFYTL